MKSFLVLVVFTFSASNGMTTSLERKHPKENSDTEKSSEDFFFSLLPLKIILEHKLRVQHELEDIPAEKESAYKENMEMDLRKGNSKSLPEIDNQSEYVCDNIGSFNNISAEEISKIFASESNTGQDSVGKEQLQKIYDSLKNCYFVRVRNAKIWGPLWHCLNRLFLYFVFH